MALEAAPRSRCSGLAVAMLIHLTEYKTTLINLRDFWTRLYTGRKTSVLAARLRSGAPPPQNKNR